MSARVPVSTIVFIARRMAALIVIVFCVVSVTFLAMRITRGSPFSAERKIPAVIEKRLLEKYKLDGSVWDQYWDYISDLVHGDLRDSTKYRNRSVNEILAQTLPVTLSLGVLAFVLASTAGVWIGTFAAVRHGSLGDVTSMVVALLAISLPTFVIGPLLILVLALWLGWLPVGGWGGFQHMILPAMTLAAPYSAYIARLMRTSMLETLSLEFVRTARAKGLHEGAVIYKHALRVAILPVVSFLGPLAANLLTGSIVVETIFSIPGAGGFFVNSLLNNDSFLLGGVVIVYCVMLVSFNLVVDVAYTILDRRIRLDG